MRRKKRQNGKKKGKLGRLKKMPLFFQDEVLLDAWITSHLNKIWNEVQEYKRVRQASSSRTETVVKPVTDEHVSSEEEDVADERQLKSEISTIGAPEHDALPVKTSAVEEHTSSSKDADYDEEAEQDRREDAPQKEEEQQQQQQQQEEKEEEETDEEQCDTAVIEEFCQEELKEQFDSSETIDTANSVNSVANITAEEYAEKLLHTLTENEVDEEIKRIAKNYLCKERYNYLHKKICNRLLRKHFRSWQDYVRKRKTEVPFLVPGQGLKFDDILTIRPLKAPKISIFEITTFFLHLLRKCRSPNIFFKLAISCPDAQECDKLSHLSKNFTQQSFVPEDKSATPIKMSSPMLLECKKIFSNITISVRCLTGPKLREGDKEDCEAMSGADGAIFWLSANKRTWQDMQNRFDSMVTSKYHYRGIPVSLIVVGEVDIEDVMKHLNVQDHISEGRISHMSVHKCNKQDLLDSMFSQALSYVFLTCHGKPLVHITTIRKLIIQLMERTWDKVIDARKFEDMLKMNELPARRAFEIHNIAFRNMLKLTTSEQLLRCTIGAPEFKKFLPKTEVYEDLTMEGSYGIMPSYFKTEEYKTYLTNLFTSMQVQFFDTWPPSSPEHFKTDLLKLCRENFIDEEAASELISMTYCSNVPTHLIDTWLTCFENTSWTCFMQKFLKLKLESMECKLKSSDGEYVVVAVDSEQLRNFPGNVWKDYVVSMGHSERNATVKRLHSPESASGKKKLKVD